jgi:hypothetical protein
MSAVQTAERGPPSDGPDLPRLSFNLKFFIINICRAPTSVDSKELGGWLSLLDATFTKNEGGEAREKR